MNLRWFICFRLLVTNAKTLEVRLLLNLQILVSQACQLAWEATLIGLTNPRGVMELFELVGFGMYEEENNSNFNQIICLFRRRSVEQLLYSIWKFSRIPRRKWSSPITLSPSIKIIQEWQCLSLAAHLSLFHICHGTLFFGTQK